jgi:aldose 1-epimerase
MDIKQESYGKTAGGQEVTSFTCTNAQGLVLQMINLGATVVRVETPDRSGKLANINTGFDTLREWEEHTAFFGATVGRYANRIAGGRFELDGKTYKLATNNGPNHLHGGVSGFNRKLWKAEPVKTERSVGVRFNYISRDGEEGYPGTLNTTVVYELTNDDELKITYTATTDKPTVLNLTNHNYWNLAGAGSGDILKHEIMINADEYLPVNKGIPTGGPAPVKGTEMDFTKFMPIGARIDKTKKDPDEPRGYDHNYCLKDRMGKLQLAAIVRDPASGREMEIHTTQPGIQFYTGNYLDGDPKNGGHKQHAAFCLETQHWPDSPNRPDYPSTVLRPGETFESVTVHKFRTSAKR